MICKGCRYEHFEQRSGNPNRYYCTHPVAAKEVNAAAKKKSSKQIETREERKHRTAPRWCPLKEVSHDQ